MRSVDTIVKIPASVVSLIRASDDMHELKDCRQFISFLTGVAHGNTSSLNLANGCESSGFPDTSGSNGPRAIKKRRTAISTDTLFHKFLTESNAREVWTAQMVDREDFIRYLNANRRSILEAEEREFNNSWLDPNSDLLQNPEDLGVSPDAAIEILETPPAPTSLIDLYERERELSSSLPSNENIMTQWFKKLPLHSTLLASERISELIVKYEAFLLGSHPAFRQLVRQWYERVCSISTVTTLEGERGLDPGKSSWIPSRLFKMPLDEFVIKSPQKNHSLDGGMNFVSLAQEALKEACMTGDAVDEYERWRLQLAAELDLNKHREYGFEMSRAEKQELIDVVMHPVSMKDASPPPWRAAKTDGELRWNRGRAKHQQDQNKSFSNRHRPPVTNESSATTDDPFVTEYEAFMESDREDEAVIQVFVHKIVSPITPKDAPPPWKNFLREIVYTAVVRECLPELRKEIKQKVYSDSKSYVIEACQSKLIWRLALGPPINSICAHLPERERRNGTFPDFVELMHTDEDDKDDVIPEDGVGDISAVRESDNNLYDSSVVLHHTPM